MSPTISATRPRTAGSSAWASSAMSENDWATAVMAGLDRGKEVKHLERGTLSR